MPIAGSEQVAIMFEKDDVALFTKKQQLIRRITIALIQQK
ncbi:Teichoic acid biosynthesis protein [Enterococcus sp. HSIEG1]|nr:Teichoic acid biosynthesis protein [Enterococcus sp. HSIEG1]